MRYLGFFGLLFALAAGWSIGEKLSADAVGMAVGILFGVMASVPAALLVLVASRGRPSRHRMQEEEEYPESPRRQAGNRLAQTGNGMPLIVMAPPAYGYPPQTPGQQQGYQTNPMLPASQQIIDAPAFERQFRIVGEEDTADTF